MSLISDGELFSVLGTLERRVVPFEMMICLEGRIITAGWSLLCLVG